MGIINVDLAAVGCFRAYLIHKPPEKTRVYEPGIQPNPLNPDGTLNEEKYNDNINVYPEALWNSKILQDAVTETVQPCWCVNEISDSKKPIIMGFMGKGIPAGNQWVGHTYGSGSGAGGTGGGGAGGPGGVDSGATISGVTQNIVFSGHGSNEPIKYLILHTIAGPSEDANAIINVLKNKDLGIHGIISNTGVVQCAEWNTIQYHCPGVNNCSIGCEMLESRYIKWNQSTWIPSWSNDSEVKAYHEGVYANAVNLYAQLAVKYNLDSSAIKSHKEAAGNHGDPESLWDQFKAKWGDSKWTMNGFRTNVSVKMEDVKKQMSQTQTSPYTGSDAAKYIYEQCLANGMTSAGACGVLANVEKESGFSTALNNGDGGKASGLCQWHPDRFSNCKTYCANNNLDYKSLQGQTAFMIYELKQYNNLWSTLTSAQGAQGAYDSAYRMCYDFERPSNKGQKSVDRGNLAKNTYYPKYGK